MRSDWWKFNECMVSGTRSPVRYIRRGEEGVRASDLGPSENQATRIIALSITCTPFQQLVSEMVKHLWVQGFCRVKGAGCNLQCAGCRMQSAVCRLKSEGCRV